MSDSTLKELWQQVAEKKSCEAKQKELTAQRDTLADRLKKLEKSKLAEQADVDRLEGHSLAAFFYQVIGKMDENLVTQPESVSVILADGTIISAVDLQDGKGGLSAGYGVSHNLDGTGWLEFDLPQPIDPNAVTYLKVDQTMIPLTAAE